MWIENEAGLDFEAGGLTGRLWNTDERSICSYRVLNLSYGDCSLGIDDSAQGSLTLFRALARDAYLTELRATPATMALDDGRTCVEWAPTLAHHATVRAIYDAVAPNTIDITIEVQGHAYYTDYELLFSHYVSPSFHAGCWLAGKEAQAIMVDDNPVYHGLYNFFPRDEHAAMLLHDGRGQRGRWYWQVATNRSYALPMVFAQNGELQQVLMGLREDVNAVGLTYRGDEDNDGVAAHKGMYFSLFGRDLHPGEAWRTKIRYMVGKQDLQAQGAGHEQFLTDCQTLQRTFQIVP